MILVPDAQHNPNTFKAVCLFAKYTAQIDKEEKEDLILSEAVFSISNWKYTVPF